jgi:hypothetical protein
MNIDAKFDALVKNLDPGALEALRRSVATEIQGREGGPLDGMKIETIRPGMSAAEKEQAAQEISRVLRERS